MEREQKTKFKRRDPELDGKSKGDHLSDSRAAKVVILLRQSLNKRRRLILPEPGKIKPTPSLIKLTAPRIYQFPPKEEISETRFFQFKKSWIKDGTWARLPKNVKSVFPVIACNYNPKSSKAWLEDAKIQAQSGRAPGTVREAIKGLKKHWPRFMTGKSLKGRKFYSLELSGKGSPYFQFFLFILESGVWSRLSSAAHSLFPVMNAYSDWDLEIYIELEAQRGNYEHDDTEDKEARKWIYKNRKYDWLAMRKIQKYLANRAGIHPTIIKGALRELEQNWLIEKIPGGYLIFRKAKDLKY